LLSSNIWPLSHTADCVIKKTGTAAAAADRIRRRARKQIEGRIPERCLTKCSKLGQLVVFLCPEKAGLAFRGLLESLSNEKRIKKRFQ